MFPWPVLGSGPSTGAQYIAIPVSPSHVVTAANVPHQPSKSATNGPILFVVPSEALASLQRAPATAQAPSAEVAEAVRMLSAAVGGHAALRSRLDALQQYYSGRVHDEYVKWQAAQPAATNATAQQEQQQQAAVAPSTGYAPNSGPSSIEASREADLQTKSAGAQPKGGDKAAVASA